MKKTTITTLLAGLVLGGSAIAGTSGKTVAITEPVVESPLTTSLTVGYASTYEYRGNDVGDNLFTATLAGSYAVNKELSIFADAWYGTLWDESYNELDLTAGVKYDFGCVTSSLLYRHYLYDGDITDNNEIGLGVTTKAWNGLTFGAIGYYDFEFEGFYFELGAEYSYKICDISSIVLGTGVAYDIDYNGVDGESFNHVYAQASLPITLRENVTLTPFIRSTFAIDEFEENGGDDILLGGANLTVTF